MRACFITVCLFHHFLTVSLSAGMTGRLLEEWQPAHCSFFLSVSYCSWPAEERKKHWSTQSVKTRGEKGERAPFPEFGQSRDILLWIKRCVCVGHSALLPICFASFRGFFFSFSLYFLHHSQLSFSYFLLISLGNFASFTIPFLLSYVRLFPSSFSVVTVFLRWAFS